MDDLLKEAIADAKAVRETALENAKMALEEAFTPRLQNMLSQKIQSEIEDEDGEEMEDEMAMNDEDEDPSDEDSMDAPVDDVPAEDEEEDVAEVSVNEEDIIEIDGVKYAPVVSEEDEEDMGDEEMGDEDEMEESDDLDLEAVIKELESELDEADEVDEAGRKVRFFPGRPTRYTRVRGLPLSVVPSSTISRQPSSVLSCGGASRSGELWVSASQWRQARRPR